MTTAALILAAGKGTRAGGRAAKQWRQVAGRRVVDWTLDAFRACRQVDLIVLVLPPDETGGFAPSETLLLAQGGDSRPASVRAGLAALQGRADKVLIHDVARCCISQRVITDVIAALDTHDAAAPGLAVTDALWQGDGGRVTGTQARAGLYAAQTPQGFRLPAISAAHEAHAGDAADDVEVARAAGLDIAIVPGDPDNLKITGPEDFDRARRILESRMDIRLGNGFDVHRFGPGDHVTLCGVNVPFHMGLDGHSDADVGMHAVTDAIYGALAQGDIGRHFPPSDPQWKGAESRIFLEHAAGLVRDAGMRIANVDVTLICEEPKIGPHADRMRGVMADLMGIGEDRVSVKATTSERLGFTGRGEGIAALATCCLVSA
jgi:2-C-methyl-D-erythritol 4-phosphate cytidylyltransferase/2-C-methyl-D-erythritol 2,4-cyclodiphosphate synthase